MKRIWIACIAIVAALVAYAILEELGPVDPGPLERDYRTLSGAS